MGDVPSTLNVGCGQIRIPNSVGVDFDPGTVADVIHDLDVFPWPFPDRSFDRIVCSHVLEHLRTPWRAMKELERLARPGALVEIATPHYSSPDSWGDITHYMHYSLKTWEPITGAGTETALRAGVAEADLRAGSLLDRRSRDRGGLRTLVLRKVRLPRAARRQHGVRPAPERLSCRDDLRHLPVLQRTGASRTPAPRTRRRGRPLRRRRIPPHPQQPAQTPRLRRPPRQVPGIRRPHHPRRRGRRPGESRKNGPPAAPAGSPSRITTAARSDAD
jgi:SAM-dependent methyltransferase